MERLTDEQRATAVTVWSVAQRHVEYVLTRNPHLRRHRDDLTSQAALLSVRIAGNYRPGPAKLETFALGHLKHLVSEWTRASKRRVSVEPVHIDRVPCERFCPVTECERRDAPRRVAGLLAKLNGAERAVVEAVGLREMTHPEAASELGCSAVRTRYVWSRAVKRLGGETRNMRHATGE